MSSERKDIIREEEKQRNLERARNVVDLASTVMEGNQPSNVQLKKVIAQSKAGLQEIKSKSEAEGTLQPEGEQVINQTSALLSDARLLLDQKNRDEKFQKFFSDASDLVEVLKRQAPSAQQAAQAAQVAANKFKDTFNQYAEDEKDLLADFISNLRVLLMQMAQSSEFRSLLVDSVDILRSFFIRGTEELQQNVDQKLSAVQQNIAQKGDLIDLSAPLQPSQKQQQQIQPQQPALYSTVGQFSGPEKYMSIQKPAASSSAQPSQQFGAEYKPFQYSSATNEFKYETQKVADRFFDILARFANNAQFANALRAQFYILSSLKGEIEEKAQEAKVAVQQRAQSIWYSQPLQNLLQDAVAIFEAFAGEGTWQPFINDLNKWVSFIQNDTRTKEYFGQWQSYIYEALDNPERLSDVQFRQRSSELLDRGVQLGRELKWSSYTQRVFDKAQKMLDNITNDPLMKKIAKDTQNLAETLLTDENGQIQYKPEIISQMREIFVSMFTEQMKNIPIPQINDTADGPFGKFDYTLDNIVFSAYDILPNHVLIRTLNEVDFNLKELRSNSTRTELLIKIENIEVHLRDIEFAFRRVSAPHIQDSGVANVDISGQGASLLIHMFVNPPSQMPMFNVQRIEFTIHDLTVRTKDSKMDTVYNMLTGLFSGTLKKYMENRVESQLSGIIDTINLRLNQLVTMVPASQLKEAIIDTGKAALGISEQPPATIATTTPAAAV